MKKIHIKAITNPMHHIYIGLVFAAVLVLKFSDFSSHDSGNMFEFIGENTIFIGGVIWFLIVGVLSLITLHKNRKKSSEIDVVAVIRSYEHTDALIFTVIVAFLFSGYEGDVAGFVEEYIFTVSLTALLWIAYIYDTITLEIGTLR